MIPAWASILYPYRDAADGRLMTRGMIQGDEPDKKTLFWPYRSPAVGPLSGPDWQHGQTTGEQCDDYLNDPTACNRDTYGWGDGRPDHALQARGLIGNETAEVIIHGWPFRDSGGRLKFRTRVWYPGSDADDPPEEIEEGEEDNRYALEADCLGCATVATGEYIRITIERASGWFGDLDSMSCPADPPYRAYGYAEYCNLAIANGDWWQFTGVCEPEDDFMGFGGDVYKWGYLSSIRGSKCCYPDWGTMYLCWGMGALYFTGYLRRYGAPGSYYWRWEDIQLNITGNVYSNPPLFYPSSLVIDYGDATLDCSEIIAYGGKGQKLEATGYTFNAGGPHAAELHLGNLPDIYLMWPSNRPTNLYICGACTTPTCLPGYGAVGLSC